MHQLNWYGKYGPSLNILPNGGAKWFYQYHYQNEMQPEGEWDLIMHGPDGTDYKNKSIFKEIIPLKKIVYAHVSNPKFVSTITFEAKDGQTLINWHMLFETAELFNQVVKTFKADEGLKQNLEKLGKYVKEVR